MRKPILVSVLVSVAVLVMLAAAGWLTATRLLAGSLSGRDFRADRIIDDALFYNGNALTVDQIQSFLNARVPVCDTHGQRMINATQTRAQWAQANGRPLPPYICLKDFRQDHGARSDSGLCSPIPARTNQSAAQIIDTVARACNISQKVLLVKLEKEQSLVTDDWPWPIQYEKATGFYCPDDPNRPGWCHPDFAGFFNQVYAAARQFNRYRLFPQQFNHADGRTSFVHFQAPSPAWPDRHHRCGGSHLTMQNAATAGLYNYTPYQPSQAALDHLYGAVPGNSNDPNSPAFCAAYGNRNFWRLFTDWFGHTHVTVPFAWRLESQEAYIDSARTIPFTNQITVAPGSEIFMRIRARNLGHQTWSPAVLRVGTSGPTDRVSDLRHPSWLSDTRPAALREASVRPFHVGTFDFVLRAPSAAGSVVEHFNLVADGHTWLNDIGLFYPINFVAASSPVNLENVGLGPGQSLTVGQHLLSTDGQSVLALQTDGNLVLYTNFRPVWWSGTAGRAVSRLTMQTDGNLVLYGPNNAVVWTTHTHGNSGARLTTQTDGNLVLYNAQNMPLWSTRTTHVPDLLAYVNNTLLTNSWVFPGQRLQTPTRNFTAAFQTDGNLVVYDRTGRALWHSGTSGNPNSRLTKQADGNLVIYNQNWRAIWHTGTYRTEPNFLALQEDGNLVMYQHTVVRWASNSQQRP